MKHGRTMVLIAIAALPHLAQARASVDAQSFGAAQGVLDYCSRVDPGNDAKFDRHAKSLISGKSPAQVSQERSSSEYRSAYKSISTLLSGFAPQDGKDRCEKAANAIDEDF